MTTLTFPHFDYVQRAQLLAYIKQNKWVFDISYQDDELMSKDQLYAKIDKGIEEYKSGITKKLNVSEIDSFLGL